MLVVEDNPDHLELTVTTLQQNGLPHDIVVARDGLEALDYLFCQGIHSGRNPQDQPELVLLDLGMPKMNGIEVMQHMRDDPRTFAVPVIMLTSANEQSEGVLALQGKLNTFVSKPLEYGAFEEKLLQFRKHWQGSRPAPLSA
jgi:two-component system response regulator